MAKSKLVLKSIPSTRRPATHAEPVAPNSHDPDERHRMIAENAYYRALRRGLTGGDPLVDWLDAEREINRSQ